VYYARTSRASGVGGGLAHAASPWFAAGLYRALARNPAARSATNNERRISMKMLTISPIIPRIIRVFDIADSHRRS